MPPATWTWWAYLTSGGASPGSFPAGCSSACPSLALIGAIVAEFFGTPVVGMGFRISMEAMRMNLGLVWAEIVLASLTGTLAYAVLSLLERRVAFWHPSFR